MSFFSPIIFSAVELSSFFSLLAVLLSVGAMITFFVKAAIILRVQDGDAIRATTVRNHNTSVQVPRLKMTRVHIPFTFRLLERVNTSYEGNQVKECNNFWGNMNCDCANGALMEVCLAVSSQVKYTLQAFWAVSIRELHMSLWRPWTELREVALLNECGIVDAKHYQHLAINIKNRAPHSEQIITLKSPIPPLALGAPPRLSYPLVIFLIREFDCEENLHPDETVVLVNVVHLRDPVCPLPTSVLAQYLKQASGQLSCLKQLYLAAGDGTSEETTPTQTGSLSLAEPVACAGTSGPILCSDGPQTEQLCVVCHYFPLSRALLPCRHTCICAICFAKLERCPMCRAPITSYFCIRSEEYLPPATVEPRSATRFKGGTSVHWLDALNDRLTDFLGFR